jgi:alkylation response protein AidB-like acyl-CoA dehydrogenase
VLFVCVRAGDGAGSSSGAGHGGAGYLSDNPVGRIFRDAKLMEIGAGTSEIRRMLIGREMMGAMA